jgi:hypothetical protein
MAKLILIISFATKHYKKHQSTLQITIFMTMDQGEASL